MTEPCPMPMEWHPAYADQTWLYDWLSTGRPHDHIVMSIPQRLQWVPDAEMEPIAPAMRTRTLTRRRCAGPAPYVGRPFCYSWWAAVDELGRGIASDSTIQYLHDEAHDLMYGYDTP